MNLSELTPQIARYLDGWQAALDHPHLTRLTGHSGRELVLRLERERLLIVGCYPRYQSEVVITEADDQPRISLNPHKAPQRLAADILRRFLPRYEDLFRLARQRVAAYEQEARLLKDHVRRITAIVGEAKGDSEVYLSQYNPQNGANLYGRFIVTGRNTLTLSLTGLSLAQAIAVAQALKLPPLQAGCSYAVFYARNPTFLDSGLAGTTRLVTSDLPHTHRFITAIHANSLDEVYRLMQAEQWSPNGEARPIIEAAGVSHTSLSIGDVVCDANGTFFECVSAGWRRVELDLPLHDCWHCRQLRAQSADACPHCGAAELPG